MQKSQSTIYATIWSFIERASTQIVSFIIGIILARLLSPEDYGIIGLTTIFIALSNIFIDSGFANGLIRKVNRTENDMSTAFHFNLIVGILTYTLLWFSSPFISNYFNEPILDSLLKIVGLNVLLNSVCIVQTAILTSNLDIKGQTIINLCGQIPAGLLAIYLAYNQFGVYALAIQSVTATFIRVVFLWLYTKWKPNMTFSSESFKYLWGFGSKLLAANLIGTFFNEIYSLLIGKYISKKDLGYYSKAYSLNFNIDSVATGIIQKIALPVLSKYQCNKAELTLKYKDYLCFIIMILSPIIAILFVISEELIVLLWSDKWIECSIIFQILIIGSIFNPISCMSLSLLQVVGQSHTILKLEFPKKLLYVIYIFIGFHFGIIGLVVARLFINITGSLMNIWATRNIVYYPFKVQFFDIFSYILKAFIITILSINIVNFTNPVIYILSQLITISGLYILLLYFTKDKYLYAIYNHFKYRL